MKIWDFRKYFFANISALWCYILIYFLINYVKTDYPQPTHNDVLALGSVDIALILLALLILMCLISVTILEILIRKYIIEKKFPNFKLNIKIRIPKAIVSIYNVVFSIGFILACVLFLNGLVNITITAFNFIFS